MKILLIQPSRLNADGTVFHARKFRHRPPEELEEGFWRFQHEFYSIPSILRRLFTPPKPYTPRAFAANLFFRHGAGRRVHPLAYD